MQLGTSKDQEEQKFKGTYQVLIYSDDNLLVNNIHTIKKNTASQVRRSI
jgi:hypothetical protein